MQIFRKMDKPLLYITIILFLFGCLMILSSSNMEAFVRYNASPYKFFFRQGFFLVVGLIASLFIIRVPTSKYKNFVKTFLWLIIGFLFLLFSYGKVSNNAASWVGLGTFGIQPSEFAKVIMIIYIATYYEKHKNELNNISIVIMPLVITALLSGLILIQPDLGTAVIIFILSILLIMSVNIAPKIKKQLYMVGVGALLIISLIVLTSGENLLSKEQKERLNFFSPCTNYANGGYQVCNGYIAIHNGGLFGVGLGNSTQKYLYLPEAHTDFIFAIIMEEMGLVIALVILSLYAFILMRIYKIAMRSHTIRGRLIAYGIAIYIFLHIFINLGGLFGIAPYTGVPLPFLSYGGSFCLSLIVALTIVQRIEIENKMHLSKTI